MPTQFMNPPGLAPTNGWTQVVTSTGGKTIYVSGQVSVDEHGQVVGKGDLKAQTEQTFANLEVALTAAGASFRDVVKMNLYVVGLKPELVPLLREVRGRYVIGEPAGQHARGRVGPGRRRLAHRNRGGCRRRGLS